MKNDQLTIKEQQIAGKIILYFRKFNNGKKEKSSELVDRIKKSGHSFSDSDLRIIIGHIRRNDLCSPGFILSDRNGYWYSEKAKELQEVWENEHGRALSILKNFAPLRKRFKHLLNEEGAFL